MSWDTVFKYNPIKPLLKSADKALHYFVQKELLDNNLDDIASIWELPEVLKILRKQLKNGSFKSTSINQKKYPAINYNLIETWKQFRYLVHQYGFDKSNPNAKIAAEYIFSCQSDEGDIRGMLANQYAAYYTGALLGLLIDAGYVNDKRIERGLKWLISVRQDDGGWLALPITSLNLSNEKFQYLTTTDCPPLNEHDKTKPSSHNWTGMVIRAFAAHPLYKTSPETIKAANLLKSMFFQKDPHYTSYKDAGYWVKFQFPFWWNNLVAALDSLSLIGISKSDPDIKNALDWFVENQQESGLWKLSYSKKHNAVSEKMQLWITYAICRIFKRYYQ